MKDRRQITIAQRTISSSRGSKPRPGPALIPNLDDGKHRESLFSHQSYLMFPSHRFRYRKLFRSGNASPFPPICFPMTWPCWPDVQRSVGRFVQTVNLALALVLPAWALSVWPENSRISFSFNRSTSLNFFPIASRTSLPFSAERPSWVLLPTVRVHNPIL